MPDGMQIRRMFAGISPRYDLLNRLLSLGIDRRWRARTVAALGPPSRSAGTARENTPPALDVCCGTGDLVLGLAAGGFAVTGVDFCHEMLLAGRRKTLGRDRGPVRLAEADALSLPFRDGCFQAATVAFGVRNLQDLAAGLGELRRVLRPGGRLAVLEFGRPRGPLLAPLYRLYLNGLVPLVGRLVSGDGEAYAYLSTSIRGFHDQSVFPRHLRDSRFRDIRVEELTGGIANLYLARKPPL